MPRKLLLVSDSVSSHSGLARITRDLASRIHADMKDEFTIATAGWNGDGLADVPWKDYPIHNIDNWLLPELPKIAQHFASDEELIVWFISDVSRLGWFAHPDWCYIPELAEWVRTAKIKKWIYGPIDAEGPNGHLTIKLEHIYKGFDRVLNYSKFASDVTGYPDHLPHGIDTSVFQPRDKKKAREIFSSIGFTSLTEKSFLVGIVATNQARKDWALGIQTCKVLLDRGVDVQLWCHTDVIERHWDLGSLIADYGLSGRVCISTQMIPDETMNWLYSARDVTLGIGLGEGYGYPIFESLASGTPCIHGYYGGAREYMPESMLVYPVGYRYEGPSCLKRPVHHPEDWAGEVVYNASEDGAPPFSFPSELDWNNLWPRWKEWLLK